MTLEELKKYYINGNQFYKATGMSANTYGNWFKWGYIPWKSQAIIETLTNGKLKANILKGDLKK